MFDNRSKCADDFDVCCIVNVDASSTVSQEPIRSPSQDSSCGVRGHKAANEELDLGSNIGWKVFGGKLFRVPKQCHTPTGFWLTMNYCVQVRFFIK